MGLQQSHNHGNNADMRQSEYMRPPFCIFGVFVVKCSYPCRAPCSIRFRCATRCAIKVFSDACRQRVTRILISANRLESFVESDSALRRMPVERQREENLRRHTLMPKPRRVPEPEFPVVFRMSHETTSLFHFIAGRGSVSASHSFRLFLADLMKRPKVLSFRRFSK